MDWNNGSADLAARAGRGRHSKLSNLLWAPPRSPAQHQPHVGLSAGRPGQPCLPLAPWQPSSHVRESARIPDRATTAPLLGSLPPRPSDSWARPPLKARPLKASRVGPEMSEAAAILRETAARWRLLAQLLTDEQAWVALLSLASELEMRAAALEAEQNRPREDPGR